MSSLKELKELIKMCLSVIPEPTTEAEAIDIIAALVNLWPQKLRVHLERKLVQEINHESERKELQIRGERNRGEQTDQS